MSIPLTEIERINALLPTELFAGSKDWRVGSIADRVDWLLTMYSSAKEEVERLQSALEAQPAQQPINCRHCGGPDNVLCGGQCKEQPAQQQEPVLMFYEQEWQGKTSRAYQWLIDPFSLPAGTKLYTSPPARKPLTDEEMYLAIRPLFRTDAFANAALELSKDEYQAIEAAHGIKENA